MASETLPPMVATVNDSDFEGGLGNSLLFGFRCLLRLHFIIWILRVASVTFNYLDFEGSLGNILLFSF